MSYRWAVNIFFFLNGLIYATWAARLPRLQENLSLDNKMLGFVLLAHSIGAFIAMPITGWMIHKFSSKRVTIVSGVLFPLFFLLIPFATSQWAVFIPFLLMGAATGVMDVAMNAQAVIIEEHLKKPIMTMFHALFSIGMVCGGLVGGFFTSNDSSLIFNFSLIGIITLAIILWASKFLYPDQGAVDDEDGAFFVLPKGPIIILGIIAFCCMMGEGAMADWSAIYMKNVVQSSLTIQTFGLTAFAAMMTLGRLFGDRGRAVFGDRKMMVYGGIASLLGMVFILSLLNPWIIILGFGLVGLGLSNIVPIVYSLAGSYPGIPPGVGIAMATTIGYSGFMVGPVVIGFIADALDLKSALFFLSVMFVLMLILVLIFTSKKNASKA